MVTVNRGEPMRRRKLPGGEKRTEKVPMVRCSPSEMLTIERAARLRGMAVAAFVGDCAVRTAEGRLRPARAPRSTSSATPTPVDVESPGDLAYLVEPLQAVLQELFAVRRQLAGAMTNLNQLTAAVNSGGEATAEQIAATLAHVERQLVSYRDVEDLVSTTVRELA